MKKLKTEHAGAKKGSGAFYGHKADAKKASNTDRRRADKDAATREAPKG